MLKRIHLFRGVDEQKLHMAYDYMEVLEQPAGTTIFQQGDIAEHFYLILDGRVALSRFDQSTKQFIPIGALDEDDYFGQEVLDTGWPRQLTAEAGTDCILLRLDVDHFVALVNQLPFLTKRLQLILDSYRLMLKSQFSWLNPNETIHFIARHDPWFLANRIILPSLFGLVMIPLFLFLYLTSLLSMTMLALLMIVIAITVGWWMWVYIDWTNDYYIVTNQRTIFLEKIVLLYDSRQESPNESLQSTSTSTTQLGRILGYGSVAIRTFIGTILFRDVSAPDQVMAIIQEHQLRAQSNLRRAELKAMESSIERKIGLAPPPPPSAAKQPPPPQMSPLQRLLTDLLHLRYEIGGTILYRTHWYILLKKIIVPSLLLIGLVALFFMRLGSQFTAISVQATCGLTGMLAMIVSLWWAYQYSDWHNDIYLITPDQIVDVNKKPLGRESRQSAPIKNILSIEYRRLGIIGLVLNYGTVYIRVGDQQLTFDDVYNPSEVQRELFHRLAARNYAEKQAQADSERQRMAEWIAAYHRVTQRSNQSSSRPPTSRGGF